MLSLDLWSITQSDAGSEPVDRKQLGFIDPLAWLKCSETSLTRPSLQWKTEIITVYIDSVQRNVQFLRRLASALGFDHEDVGPIEDTVQFNSYRGLDTDSDPLSPENRLYCLSDNVFGIFWVWSPATQSTKGLMYGVKGEGADQMHRIWRCVCESHLLATSPLAVATFVLEAEVCEMRKWVSTISERLVALHIQTGHHNYARTTKPLVIAADLARMSRDVCGYAINMSTSVLCLQRILKFADFVLEDVQEVHEMSQGTAGTQLTASERRAQYSVQLRAKQWRRRASNPWVSGFSVRT